MVGWTVGGGLPRKWVSPRRGPINNHRETEMRVEIDQVWATPSTLHVRVIVHADDNRWRHKYYPSIPVAEIPEEALYMLVGKHLDDKPEEDHHQTALF
jgi:hypothetical protein